MGFLQSLFKGREIGRLEDLIKTSPAPSLFLRLAQLYRENGQAEQADEITRRGAKLFPESEALTQAQADADKARRDAERHRLRSRIEQFPSPMLYAKLAELCIEDGDFVEAGRVSQAGLRSYPEYGGLWVVEAEIASRQKDLQQASRHLEKATQLDKYNYNALMMLAEVYLRLGNRKGGREALEKILFFAPGDAKATQWLAEFDVRAKALEAEAEPEVRLPPPPSRAGDLPPVQDTKKQRTTIIEAAAVRAKSADGRSASGVGTGLQNEIREVRRVEGVQGSVLIDPFGLVIASDLPDGRDEELVAALLTSICRTAEQHAKELTLGDFEDGIIDCDERRIHILRVDQMIMGVLADKTTKAGLLQRAIHTFAERVLDTQ